MVYRTATQLFEDILLFRADNTLPKLRRQLVRTQLLIIDDLGIRGDFGAARAIAAGNYRPAVAQRFAVDHQPVPAGKMVRTVRRPDDCRCNLGSDHSQIPHSAAQWGVDAQSQGQQELTVRKYPPCLRAGWSSVIQLLVKSNANGGHDQCNWVVKSDAISQLWCSH